MVRLANRHSSSSSTSVAQNGKSPRLSQAEAIWQAADKGHLETLQTMQETGVALLAGGSKAICLAASRGNIEILQYLAENGLTPKVAGGDAVIEASAGGQLEVLKWFLEQGVYPRQGGEAAVYAAAHTGNLEVLDWLSQRGLDVKDRYEQYAKAAIHGASTGGCIKILEWLLALGVDIKEGGGAAIRGAAKGGYLPVLKWLTANGLEAQEGGRWAVRAASEFGHTSVVQWLWDQGLDISTMPGTPIRGACAGGHLDLLKWLRSKGVELSGYGDVVWSLRLAAEGGHIHVIKWLSEHPGKDFRIYPEYSEALIRGAAKGGHLRVLEWLVSFGINIRPHNKYVIWAAVEGGHLDILEWLSKQKMPFGQKFAVKEGGGAAIWLAAKIGSVAVLQWLLRYGVKAKEGGGNAIRVAAAHGHLGVLQFFAENGLSPRLGGGKAIDAAAEGAHIEILEWFDVHGLDIRHNGIYPATGAAKGGSRQVLHWLARNKCDMRNGGAGTICEAAAGGHLDILRWLSVHGLPPQTGGGEAIRRAAEGGHLEVLQWMVENGVQLEEIGFDATRGASKGGQVMVLEWFLENGLDLRRYGQDAIIAAAASGRLEILRWLLKNGVVALVGDGDPLRMAAAGGHREVLEWMIRNGHDLHEHGWATVCAASEAGQMEIIEWLSNNGLSKEVAKTRNIEAAKTKSSKKVHSKQNDDATGMQGLKWMLANTPVKDENVRDGIHSAGASGHLEVLQWLSQLTSDSTEDENWAIRLAVSGGHLEPLQWLVQDGLSIKDHAADAVRVAAECGHQEMLKWFEQSGVLDNLGGTLIEAACMGGHLRELLHHFDVPLHGYPNSVSNILEGVHSVSSTFLANLLLVSHEVAESVLKKVTEEVIVKNHLGHICNRAHMARYLKAATFKSYPTFDVLERSIAKQNQTFLDRVLQRNHSVPVRLAKIAVRGALSPSVLRALSITPRKNVYQTLAAQSIILCAWQKVRLFYTIDFVLDIVAVAAVCHLTAMARADMGDGPVETVDSGRIAFNGELPIAYYPLSVLWIKDVVKDVIKAKCFLWDHNAWYEDYFKFEHGWDWFRNVATGLLLWQLMNGGSLDVLCHLLSVIGFSRWWKVLFNLRGYEVFGVRILPVLGAFQEVLPFLLVIFFCGGAFVHASYVLAHQRTVIQVIDTIYRLGVLADSDKFEDVYGSEEVWTVGDAGVLDSDDPPYLPWRSLQMFWFFATSFLFTVALMNIFIGIMSNAFDRQEQKCEASFLRTRTCISLAYLLRIEFWRRLFFCTSRSENEEVIWVCYQDVPLELVGDSRSLRQAIKVMFQEHDQERAEELSKIQRSVELLERMITGKDANLHCRDSIGKDANPPRRDTKSNGTSASHFERHEADAKVVASAEDVEPRQLGQMGQAASSRPVTSSTNVALEVPEELN